MAMLSPDWLDRERDLALPADRRNRTEALERTRRAQASTSQHRADTRSLAAMAGLIALGVLMGLTLGGVTLAAMTAHNAYRLERSE